MTTNSVIIKYPLDLTGLSPDNLVTNESHIAPRERARGFAPKYGAFFTKSIRIIHVGTGQPLAAGRDYICLHLYEKATRATGQEVCAAVLITNDAMDGEFLITYQVLGGEFSGNVEVIEDLLAQLALDNRPVKWGDILGLPNAFPPSEHLHDIDDLYGFEYMVDALERIRAAILLGDYHDHDEIRQRIENLKLFLEEQDQQLQSQIDAHLKDASNPHKTTKAQVGLGNVDNFLTATQVQAETGTDKQSFMTPFLTMASIEHNALTPLRAHIADKSNPHATTKAQVGLGLVDNFATATQVQAETATDKQTFMTPFLTMASIARNALVPLQAHIDDKGNPHQTTKAQVGLGNVDNFVTASQATAEAGVDKQSFMTPFTTMASIGKNAIAPLNQHIADKANPHSTTKAQVGLGNVDNFATASDAEALAGTSRTVFMTPFHVAALVDKNAGAALKGHVDDKGNPHATTKAQVGLGSVDNFATATVQQAAAAAANNLFVTPAGLNAFWDAKTPWLDARYVIRNSQVDGSIHISYGRVYVWCAGAWRQIWPAQWA